MSVNISIEKSTFKGKSQVVGVINEGKASIQAEDTLKELESLRQDLDKVEQLREAITSLEAAIRAQNQPKVQSIIQQLTSSFTSSFFSNVVSNIVSPFL